METPYCTASNTDGFIATEDDSLDWLFPLGDIGDDFAGAIYRVAYGAP